MYERVLGSEHPDTLWTWSNLANVLDEKGKYAEEEAESRDVIKLQEKVLGPEHPSTLRSCYYFASGLKHQNKLQAAKEFARRVAEGARKVLNPDHPSTKNRPSFCRTLARLNANHESPDK
jgi:hypothetical protein